MLVKLGLVICLGAIFIIFSREFITFGKRIFSIPGVKLLLPLAIASLLIELHEEWGRWLLLRLQSVIHQFLHDIATLLPVKISSVFLVRIIYLFLLAMLPLCVYLFRARNKTRAHSRRLTYVLFSLGIWIVAVILLTVVSV